MKYSSLTTLLEQLKKSPIVIGIFLTGSSAEKILPSSDIDIVIILDHNTESIRSIFTNIENHFADIYFFDRGAIDNLLQTKEIPANGIQGMLATWLGQGEIKHDPSGLLKQAQQRIAQAGITFAISDVEKSDAWVKVNYNFIANQRYASGPPETYQLALELRLLYSVIEAVTAYFILRDFPWRGEKQALEYFRAHDQSFISTLTSFLHSTDITAKMATYTMLFQSTVTERFPEWPEDFLIPVDVQTHYRKKLSTVWEELLSNKKASNGVTRYWGVFRTI